MVDYAHRLKKAREHIENTDDILKANTKHIINFVDFISAEGVSKPRQVKYIYNLKTIARLLDKDFQKATKQDMVKLCSEINNSNYSDWTKHDFLAEIKRFYKWLKDTDEFPTEVKWIKTNMAKSKTKLPKQLLSIDDVKQLAEHTNNLRDRCLILVLYELGCRIGELQNIKIKDVEFDKYGALINLFGKTGARKIRICASAPSISNWLQEHPNKTLDKKQWNNSYLFCGLWGVNKGNQLMYRHINKLLKEAGEKSNIDKPLNPHHFRHSRATELAKKLTESQLCQYVGWVQGSKEASTYVHLSGRDMEKAILQMHGIIENERYCFECKKQIDEKYDNDLHKGICPYCNKQTNFVLESQLNKFKIIECPRCTTKNDPSSKFCSQCSLGLDDKSIMEYDQQKELATETGFNISEILENKEFRMQLLKMMADEWKKIKEKED